MKANEFIEKLKYVCDKCKTLYVMGCFGSPMTSTNKNRFTSNHVYNMSSNRRYLINKATSDTFGFDCVNLIKGIAWGWNGDKNKTHGGAKYCSNGVKDVSADGMIALCKDVKRNDWDNILPGEAVWIKGHIGVYIGNGLVIECSPKWKNCVQYTYLGNIKKYRKGNYRMWTKHGKLPFIDYETVDLNNVAKDVIAGKYGNGDERKENLKKAGYDYKEVQAVVNKLLK